MSSIATSEAAREAAATNIWKEKTWLYQKALNMLHATLESPVAAPLCMREMVYELGWDGVDNDPLYSLLTELQDTGYWYHNWAPYDEDREYLFTDYVADVDEIEPAMDAIRVYIKRFN